jgi:hypothetical protein
MLAEMKAASVASMAKILPPESLRTFVELSDTKTFLQDFIRLRFDTLAHRA